MPPAASSIFNFLSRNETCSIERHEIASATFGALRRNMGAIIGRLSTSEDLEAAEVANSLRVLLFTWLTSPVSFDASILDAVQSFGAPDAFEARWGLRGEYKAALRAAQEMILGGNPVREELLAAVRKLRADGRMFKIFCHRKARGHFDSLFIPPTDACLDDSSFLHSVRDYNNADPFNTLIKVGPLRSKGWGAAPDAVISAPRFETLVQLVWSGCGDEPGFGYDPVGPPPTPGNAVALHHHDTLPNQICWTKHVIHTGSDPGVIQYYMPEQDEFVAFPEPNQPGLRRSATLLEILAGDGILYPRKSDVLSFNPNAGAIEPVDFRVPGETLVEGMFVVQPQIREIAFGEMQAAEGGYCRIWKQRLREELQASPDAFCLILHNKGLNLQSLRLCVENWAEPPHAVIHAPQKRRHFQILIDALALDSAITEPVGRDNRPWWQRAWDEIRITRGEAIQTGIQEHELIEQQALELMKSLLPEIRTRATGVEGFRLQIPPGSDLRGAFVFFKVLRIEEGFLAPETEMKVVRDLNTLEQWKVT